jgi:hypothetical protein
LFAWAPFRSTKAAIKLHTLLDLRGAIPAFIHISDGKLHDINVLDTLAVEAGAFFVTRAKSPMDARRVYSAPTDRSTGVVADQQVMLNGHYSAKKYPEHLPRVRFKDPESGKTLVFLTNNTTLPALTIAALYKSRFQVELFFDVATQCTSAYVNEYQGRAVRVCGLARLSMRERCSEACNVALPQHPRRVQTELCRLQAPVANPFHDNSRADLQHRGRLLERQLAAMAPLAWSMHVDRMAVPRRADAVRRPAFSVRRAMSDAVEDGRDHRVALIGLRRTFVYSPIHYPPGAPALSLLSGGTTQRKSLRGP